VLSVFIGLNEVLYFSVTCNTALLQLETSTSLYIGCCDAVRLPSQNCGLGPIVLSPGDSDVDLGRRDRLGLTPNLSARTLWPSPGTSLERVGYGRRK
jgi:hypothetical protein